MSVNDNDDADNNDDEDNDTSPIEARHTSQVTIAPLSREVKIHTFSRSNTFAYSYRVCQSKSCKDFAEPKVLSCLRTDNGC